MPGRAALCLARHPVLPYIFPGRSMNYYGTRRRGHDLVFHSEALFASGLPFLVSINDVPEAWELYSRAGSITRLCSGKNGSKPELLVACCERRNGWSNPVASAGLRLQSCAQHRIARPARPAPGTRPAPGPHQARTRPQSDFDVERGRISDFGGEALRSHGTGDRRDPDFGTCPRGVPRKVPLQTGRFFCALFGPKESGDEACIPRSETDLSRRIFSPPAWRIICCDDALPRSNPTAKRKTTQKRAGARSPRNQKFGEKNKTKKKQNKNGGPVSTLRRFAPKRRSHDASAIYSSIQPSAPGIVPPRASGTQCKERWLAHKKGTNPHSRRPHGTRSECKVHPPNPQEGKTPITK